MKKSHLAIDSQLELSVVLNLKTLLIVKNKTELSVLFENKQLLKTVKSEFSM